MGNQLAGIAPSQIFPVEYYLADIPDFFYDANLGSTRFFKVARAKYKEGLTVVKVFAIHDPSLPLKVHKDRLDEIRRLLSSVPNCLPFQKYALTDKAGILIRQFVKDNLYDRISTRPFLNSIEKRWIAFQILQCMNNCHNLGVCHGDIKLENIMVTSWNWILVTDFASFKPTYLPEDNPADFNYFFDTSRRRICYIAPERLVKSLSSDPANNATNVTSLMIPDDQMKKGDLIPSMDIFSVGCVLTELFTEGHSPFDFSQLLAYRNGEYTPWKVLEKIDDIHIRELVHSMIDQEASKRLSMEEYLCQQYNCAFPDYFYSFLGDYVKTFASYPFLSPDEKIHRLTKDIRKIVDIIVGYEEKQRDTKQSDSENEEHFSEGLVLIVPLLTSTLRALKHSQAKLNALDVLKTLAEYLSPDIILDRLLPYLVFLAKDHDPRVRAAAIYTLTDCLTLVKTLPRSDSNVFPEYILPNLYHIATDPAVIVRMAYAENVALLAETALRFLEMTQVDTECESEAHSSGDGPTPHNQASYDHELQTLQELVQQSVTILLSDQVNAVKQTVLERGITRLCIFFGRQKGNDILLSHMITYLNDKEDSDLRSAFFDAIVGVAAYVGWQCCPIIKPLLQQGLTDTEEYVIARALSSVTDLTELGLMQKQMLYDLVAESTALLAHPNLWIRQKAVGFVCCVARCLNLADVQCKLVPLLQPFLKHSIIQVEQELVLLNAIRDPLPRYIFDYLTKLPVFDNFLECLRERNLMRSIARAGHQPMYRELESQMKNIFRRLQSDGMTEAVEDQILAMKDYLHKVHAKKCVTEVHHLPEREPGKIDLGMFKDSPKVHSILLTEIDQTYEKPYIVHSKKIEKKRVANIESPTFTMNEEWQHMFGSSEIKTPSSPKLKHNFEEHDVSAVTSDSQNSEGKFQNSTEVIPSETTSTEIVFDEKLSLLSSISEHFIKPNYCVPCQEELHSLIKKKQEEWLHNEIIRKACEDNTKEDKSMAKYSKACAMLIAHIYEHKGAINKVQPIPETPMFATCSNDGTVKVWDCERMEGKNIVNRSKLTYSKLEGPVSCMTTCHNMQSIAAASENGNIHVFRIDLGSSKSSLLHSRTLNPQEERCAVDINYFDTGSQSVLAYATLYGSVIGWDLRCPGTVWKLESYPKYGVITSFCVDPQHCWLALGTANGKIICWDLRFQLPITTIAHPTGARIRQLLLHPKKQSAVLAAIQGNNEVSMWDVETQERITTLWASPTAPLSQTKPSNDSVYSMCWSLGEKGSGLLTGGSDMRIRYWNLINPKNSAVIMRAAKEPLASTCLEYSSRIIDGTEVIIEHSPPRSGETSGHKSDDDKDKDDDNGPRRYPEMPPSGHYDCISGIAAIQTFQPLIISASRNGVVKVWK